MRESAATRPQETSDDLLSVLYTSTAREPMDDGQLTDLLRASRERNAAAGITGLLVYRAGRFFQVIEGPAAEVRRLYDSIAVDPRHHAVRTLVEDRVDERHFAEWTMGFERVPDHEETVPPGFRSTFDDLDDVEGAAPTIRAARELSLWFRVRSRAATSF
ncbi:FAD-dependent sensor of blue light [Microbacterium sp. SLBN-154]|uniref:BLUF domain-containing protein n=1 Tax=Microbacterium sp. SLBN-154 TaxID=2768458 RepID=UPI00117570F5|nr:BLUF domain-containing protein [Microbacterium sp. SLBN-154]TQK20658.1 FAD-dependent sensor of blue light [Microbacterium sp. SLBN-154]